MESKYITFMQDFTDESGVTAIEYALLATLIAMAIVSGISATGNSVFDLYINLSNSVIDAAKKKL